MPLRYTEYDARAAIAASLTYTEALRRLGLCRTGGNRAVLKRYAERVWQIPTEHFDADAARLRRSGCRAKPLAEVMVAGSTYQRAKLKTRLYDEGLKQRRCELCGQDETWRGAKIALILDHINGDATDNRLENLRILCPNCAATLDTHCGRKNRRPPDPRSCERCGEPYAPKRDEQRFCSRECGQRWPRNYPRPGARRAERPPYEELRREVAELGWSAVGRRYGVSDNAVRKWIRRYELDLLQSCAV